MFYSYAMSHSQLYIVLIAWVLSVTMPLILRFMDYVLQKISGGDIVRYEPLCVRLNLSNLMSGDYLVYDDENNCWTGKSL